jgi:hypothetical protein
MLDYSKRGQREESENQSFSIYHLTFLNGHLEGTARSFPLISDVYSK